MFIFKLPTIFNSLNLKPTTTLFCSFIFVAEQMLLRSLFGSLSRAASFPLRLVVRV